MFDDERVVAEEPSQPLEGDESTGTDETKEQPKTIGEEVEAAKAKFEGKEETSEPLADEESTAEETDGEEETGVEEFFEGEKKDPIQKRIDRLVAEKKAAEERLIALEAKFEASQDTKSEKTSYSRQQLNTAMKKAMEDGDYDLMNEIFDYKVGQVEEKLKTEYETEQKKVIDRTNDAKMEWEDVRGRYSYLSDDAEAEIYPGARAELNLNNQNSILYQLSAYLFNNPDEKTRKYYQQRGGQKLAVADALSQILKKRRGLTPKNKEATLLKKELAKEKRKKSLGGGSPGKQEDNSPKRPLTSKEALDGYIEDRKKWKDNPVKSIRRT